MEVSTKPKPEEFCSCSRGQEDTKALVKPPRTAGSGKEAAMKTIFSAVACSFVDVLGFWSLKCKQLGSKHCSDCHEKHKS